MLSNKACGSPFHEYIQAILISQIVSFVRISVLSQGKSLYLQAMMGGQRETFAFMLMPP